MNDIVSYLRHLDHHHQPSNLKPDDGANPIQDPDPIPVIDLQSLKHDKKMLEEALKNWGVFRVVNHGIPKSLLSQLQDQAAQIFSLPFESKQASCGISPIRYFWGSPSVATLTKNSNWVEGYHVPLIHLSDFQPQLPLLESFRLLVVDYGKHMFRIAKTLVEAMVDHMNLDPSKFYLSENTHVLRVYRYPHCSEDVGLGMEEHTDNSVFTILNQEADASGLEVLKDEKWLTVKPISNTLIVNVGDMVQAISDDIYKSGTHRVKVNKHRDRISLCYFVFPGEDVKIESSKYRPFTYGEFSEQALKDIKGLGHKVGLARFVRGAEC